MFIAVLITIAKKWKLPKHLSMDRWMHKENVVCLYTHTHMYIMEYFSDIKEGNPDISYNTKLESVLLSDISLTEKNKYRMISLMCGI